MKRFIIAIIIMFFGVVIFGFNCYSNIESKFNFKPVKNQIYVYNKDMGLIRFAKSEDEIPLYIKRQMDLVMKSDSIKYYIIN